MNAQLIIDRQAALLGEEATATFSPCRRYRYALTRRWESGTTLAAWIMLNPSTASAFVDDPTIRRCISFSRAWGAGGILVLNLFGLRSTDPRALLNDPDPVGPDNDAVIADHLTAIAESVGPPSMSVCPVVVAWGAHEMAAGRAASVVELLREHGHYPVCLGATKGGHPRHPLYVPSKTALVPFEVVQ